MTVAEPAGEWVATAADSRKPVMSHTTAVGEARLAAWIAGSAGATIDCSSAKSNAPAANSHRPQRLICRSRLGSNVTARKVPSPRPVDNIELAPGPRRSEAAVAVERGLQRVHPDGEQADLQDGPPFVQRDRAQE